MTERDAPSLWRPLPALAVVALLVNDHLLKGSGLAPGWLTGKLSDVAGLFFFPILLTHVLARLGVPSPRRPLSAVCGVATALAFSAVKLVPVVHAWAEAWWGTIVMDGTDLLALPAAGLAVAWMRDAPAAVPGRAREHLGVVFAAVASMASELGPKPMVNAIALNEAGPIGTWEETCLVAGPVDVLLMGQRARVKLALQARPGCLEAQARLLAQKTPLAPRHDYITQGWIALEYDSPGNDAGVQPSRPTVRPALALTDGGVSEDSVTLPLPATCAGMSARGIVFWDRMANGPVRAPLPIASCREGPDAADGGP